MSGEMKKCPHCRKEIKANTTKCRHCGGILKTPLLDATYIQAVCPQCGKVHQLHPSHEGKEFHCDCSEVIKIPPRDHLPAAQVYWSLAPEGTDTEKRPVIPHS